MTLSQIGSATASPSLTSTVLGNTENGLTGKKPTGELSPFNQILQETLISSKNEAQTVENIAQASVVNEADFTQLTTHMLQLETMVQGMVGIRDKMINAWQDLQKIQI